MLRLFYKGTVVLFRVQFLSFPVLRINFKMCLCLFLFFRYTLTHTMLFHTFSRTFAEQRDCRHTVDNQKHLPVHFCLLLGFILYNQGNINERKVCESGFKI